MKNDLSPKLEKQSSFCRADSPVHSFETNSMGGDNFLDSLLDTAQAHLGAGHVIPNIANSLTEVWIILPCQ